MALPDPVMLPDAVALWRDQIERLSEHASPCRNLTPAKWATMRANALAFCDRYGAEAHRLGWTARELFGVHPQHGTLRIDWCGSLMFSDKPPVGVEADRVLFERGADRRTKPGQEYGSPIWEFAAAARQPAL